MKIIAIVGMCGSGKSTVSDMLVKKGYQYIRLGQITLDKVKEQGLSPTEENERPIRQNLRDKYGMAAYAILNFSKIDDLLKKGNVVADDLYSWEELSEFKKRYGKNFSTLCMMASPNIRYERLTGRELDEKKDVDIKFRPMTKEEAMSRDNFDIENLNKAGPIAMADYTILNEGTIEDLEINFERFVKSFL
jgi:dephospho-CoA kinase